MNKIKNSFSKIKASDEFKDKLLSELQVNSVKLKSTNKNLYSRSSVAVASVLVLLASIISFKLAMNTYQKGTSNLGSIAYAPSIEPSTDNDYINEGNEPNSSANIASKTTESDIASKQIESAIQPDSSKINISPQKTESDITSKQIEPSIQPNSSKINISPQKTENDITPKIEVPITKNSINEKAVSSNSDNIVNSQAQTILSYNGVTNDNKLFDSVAPVTLVSIPKIQLPKANGITTAKMMPLIVYKGNVYIYTPIEIPSENAKNLLGRKLGTTKGNIDEWSTQTDYSNEFASNIGVTDVYSVNGYDEDFRIMTNITIENGKSYPEFYECLNGITIKNGEDILSKLKLQGNIVQARFQTFNDWNNGTGTFYTINDTDLLNNLLTELNKSTPYLPEDIEYSLGDYRNDDECKEVFFDLKDGSKNVTLTILKSGYVYYGYPRIYLKMDAKFCEEFWNKLGIMHIN